MLQTWWRVRYCRARIGWCKPKLSLPAVVSRTLSRDWIILVCSGSVVRSWPCEVKGRIPVYFNKVRISFSVLASHGTSAGSYMAQKCQRCFCESCLCYTSKPKQLSGARRDSSKPWQSVSANELPSWKPPKPSRMCFLQKRLSSLSKPC